MKSASLLLPIALMALVGCSSTPAGVLSQREMAELLADIHEAEGVIETERSTFATDSMKMLLRESVYRRHGVTRTEVDSSMTWYGHNIDKYMDVYDDVIAILEKRQSQARSHSASAPETPGGLLSSSYSLDGDSVDVWTASPRRRFYSESGSDFIVYRLNRDPNWEEGDSYTLQFKLLNPRRPVSVVMSAEYSDGTMTTTTREFASPGRHSLTLTTDPNTRPSNVGVSINYDAGPREVMYLDSIALIRSRRR